MRYRHAVALGTVVALAAAGCGSSAKSSTGSASTGSGSSGGKPVSVLVIQALSGPTGPEGTANANAIRATAAEINAHGGVLGRQLAVTVQDDRGQGSVAASLLQQDVASGQVPDILVDGTASPESLAMQPIINSSRILAISDATGIVGPSTTTGKEEPSQYPTKFTVSPNLQTISLSMAQHFVSEGYKRVAIIAGNDAYGQSWASAMSSAMRAAGLTVTGTQLFSDSSLDMTPQLQALQSGHPDALLAEAYGPPTGYLLQSRYNIGMASLPMVGAITFSGTDLTKVVKQAALENVTLQANKFEVSGADPNPALRQFITDFGAREPLSSIGGTILSPVEERDSLMIAVDAIKKAGTTSGLEVAKALETMGPITDTITQTFQFSSNNHAPKPDPSAYVYTKPGPVVNGVIQPGS